MLENKPKLEMNYDLKIKCECETEEFEIVGLQTKCENWVLIVQCLYCSKKYRIRIHKTTLDEKWILE